MFLISYQIFVAQYFESIMYTNFTADDNLLSWCFL